MATFFIGVDVGTQGVRVVLMDNSGNVIAGRSESLPLNAHSREEQSPQQWWSTALHLLNRLLDDPQITNDIREQVVAIGVDSTSGTVIPLDAHDEPLHDALMYSDSRSSAEGRLSRELAEKYHSDGYTGFNASSGLSKIHWYIHHYPEKVPHIATWIHAADYLTGKLCGNFRITDYTNALKSGYDVRAYRWPEYLFTHSPLQPSWFQQVVPSGTPIGTLLPALARELGLPEIQVVAGLTDGCASQIASGAVVPGRWNTTIGTTLVIKGVTLNEVNDPEGRIYSHRHPDGYWMPGGASNTGADWVNTGFALDLDTLNREAETLIPTGKAAWPLQQQGERFPFINPDARGFAPEGLGRALLYTANMEGVAYIERMAYELIESLSGEKAEAVYTAGGASNSDTWLRIRSNVLNKPIYKCAEASGAVGAAIAAASRTYFTSVAEAAAAMTRIEKILLPDQELAAAYQEGYRQFMNEMKKRNYS